MKRSITRISAIHRRLDAEIRRELARRFPDGMRLVRLKKLRLAAKDLLHRQTPARREA